MENLIQWLMKIEHLANDIYSRTAAYFENNHQLRKFLLGAAEDEALHYQVMSRAAQLYRTMPSPPQVISVDIEIRNKIEQTLGEIQEQLVAGTLSEQIVLDKIMTAEFSEWNDIFIYVVFRLKEQGNEFKYAAAEIQNHLRVIENFLEKNEYGHELLNTIRKVPAIWTENILIVEDDAMVSELLAAVLQREGNIDIAGNGKEAISKIENKYYKLVISDVDMPIMDGLAFYRQAVKMLPDIRDRFIFLTGDHSREKLDFFKQNRLRFLLKPAPITEIRKEALKILLS
jgi:CheY-like chemotaxis protein